MKPLSHHRPFVYAGGAAFPLPAGRTDRPLLHFDSSEEGIVKLAPYPIADVRAERVLPLSAADRRPVIRRAHLIRKDGVILYLCNNPECDRRYDYIPETEFDRLSNESSACGRKSECRRCENRRRRERAKRKQQERERQVAA